MRARLLVLALATGLLLGSVALAVASPQAEVVKKAKGKAKKCKGKQVRETVAGKSRCRPLRAALPKPSPVDPRLAVVKAGLTPAIGRVPDPKNNVPPPAESLYRKV